MFGKGNKWREVGLGVETAWLLRQYSATQHDGCEKNALLLVSRYRDKPLTVNGLDQLYRKLGKRAKIAEVRCSSFTFRHTFTVNYLEVGGDVYRLSRLMGHTEIKVTELYRKAVKQREARTAGISVMDRMMHEKPARRSRTRNWSMMVTPLGCRTSLTITFVSGPALMFH